MTASNETRPSWAVMGPAYDSRPVASTRPTTHIKPFADLVADFVADLEVEDVDHD